MSASPQVTPSTTLLLTNRRPFPWIGVGQKSSDAELIGSGRFTGAPQGSPALARVAAQMSSPPLPPGRFEAMYRLSPSGAWIGQPSSDGMLSSALLPPVSSIFCAVDDGASCLGLAAAAVTPMT